MSEAVTQSFDTAPITYEQAQEVYASGFAGADELNDGRRKSDERHVVTLESEVDITVDGQWYRLTPTISGVIRALACLPPGEVANAKGLVAAGAYDRGYDRKRLNVKLNEAVSRTSFLYEESGTLPLVEKLRTPAGMNYRLKSDVRFKEGKGRREKGLPLNAEQRKFIGYAILHETTLPGAFTESLDRRPAPARRQDSTWRSRSACKGMDPDKFFGPPVGAMDSVAEAAAKAVCRGCEVKRECLDQALRLKQEFGGQVHGIWGGMSERERRRLYGS